MAERIWPEINSRVNYPIKSALMSMEESGIISLDDPLHQLCVSYCTTRVASAGAETSIAAWNDHPIPSEFKLLNIQQLMLYFHITTFVLNQTSILYELCRQRRP